MWYNMYMYPRKTRHSTYNLNYHFVWIPKYRRPILMGEVRIDLEALLAEYARSNLLLLRSLF